MDGTRCAQTQIDDPSDAHLCLGPKTQTQVIVDGIACHAYACHENAHGNETNDVSSSVSVLIANDHDAHGGERTHRPP